MSEVRFGGGLSLASFFSCCGLVVAALCWKFDKTAHLVAHCFEALNPPFDCFFFLDHFVRYGVNNRHMHLLQKKEPYVEERKIVLAFNFVYDLYMYKYMKMSSFWKKRSYWLKCKLNSSRQNFSKTLWCASGVIMQLYNNWIEHLPECPWVNDIAINEFRSQ